MRCLYCKDPAREFISCEYCSTLKCKKCGGEFYINECGYNVKNHYSNCKLFEGNTELHHQIFFNLTTAVPEFKNYSDWPEPTLEKTKLAYEALKGINTELVDIKKDYILNPLEAIFEIIKVGTKFDYTDKVSQTMLFSSVKYFITRFEYAKMF